MEIAELGEFGLIRHLTNDIEPVNAETIKGVGDDCAILQFGADQRVLVTTDLLLEGVHFDLQYVPLEHLGYKSAMVNLSDIYAMNGQPRQMTVSIGLSKRFSVEDLEQLYRGLRRACSEHSCDIVGGDTSASLTGLTISITCIGTGSPDSVVTRSGAQPNDLICVSGNLGAAYMGLQLLEREKLVYNQQLREAVQRGEKPESLPPFQPDFSGREYLLERQLKPEARRDIVEALAKAGIRPTAMIDISDGLSSEIMHICEQSNTGCRIYEERIPLDYQTAAMAEELNMNVTTCALNGGEDYELLFTVPLTEHDRVAAINDVHIIGHVTKPDLGKVLVCRDGTEMNLKAQGWKAT
ncbi:MAG: thiamine-phosphate kinase [Bacteroidaceae bacterium]|nr:thiamine-phosphate kinase [Bacteroidaceae bacterium]